MEHPQHNWRNVAVVAVTLQDLYRLFEAPFLDLEAPEERRHLSILAALGDDRLQQFQGSVATPLTLEDICLADGRPDEAGPQPQGPLEGVRRLLETTVRERRLAQPQPETGVPRCRLQAPLQV